MSFVAHGIASVTGSTEDDFKFKVHGGPACDGSEGDHHHGGGKDHDEGDHSEHEGGHKGNHSGGHDDHNDMASHETDHDSETHDASTHSAGSSHTDHDDSDASGKHENHKNGSHKDADDVPVGVDNPDTELASAPAAPPVPADAQAVLFALVLTGLLGAIGGWILRVSA